VIDYVNPLVLMTAINIGGKAETAKRKGKTARREKVNPYSSPVILNTASFGWTFWFTFRATSWPGFASLTF